MKSGAALVAVALSASLAGCTGWLSRDAGSCRDVLERPAEVITQPQLEEVSNSSSNLGLEVTNDVQEPVRLTVKFNDKSAIDVRIPGHPADCHDSRVYRYSYRLPEGQVTVIATTDRADRGTAILHAGGKKRWAVVQVQDGFPLHVQVFDSRPVWG